MLSREVQGSSPGTTCFFTKMVKVEIIGAYSSAINTFLSKTSFIIISIMFFLLFLAFVVPGIKKLIWIFYF